jgi:transcriptional regulator with XRE-family HTH domain
VQTILPVTFVPKINHTEAGRIVRSLRSKSGMSLRTMARRMRLSAPFVSDLERGRRNWTENNFKLALRILNRTKP